MTIAKGTIYILTEKGSGNTPNKYSDLYPKTSADQITNLDTTIEEKVTSMISYDATKTSGDIIGTLNINGTDHVLYSTPDMHYTVATTSTNGLMSATDKVKLDGLTDYTLPTASDTLKGGIKIGNGLSMDGDTLNVTIQSNLAGGIEVLDTVPLAIDGGLWFDTTDNVPMLWLRKGEYEYSFDYSGLRYIGSNEYLKCYLPFDTSPTADAGGNLWKPVTVDKTTLPSLDYSMKKFGSASVWLPEGSYLIAENVFNFNADKWTVDFWFYGVLNNSTFNKCVFGLGSKYKYHGIGLYYDGYWFGNETASEWGERNSNYHPKTNQWVHIAVVKDNSDFYFFEDGVLVWHVTVTTAIADNHSIELGVGASSYATPDGAMYIDSFRYFDGVARWTENFTPPTANDYSNPISPTTSSTIPNGLSGGGDIYLWFQYCFLKQRRQFLA